MGVFRVWMVYFNPRSREGSDLEDGGDGNLVVTISIHAPVKGATSIRGQKSFAHRFQSTLP